MYTLKDFLVTACERAGEDLISDEILCTETNLEKSMLANRMKEAFSGYTYTLVLQGELHLYYGGKEVTLRPGDLFTYLSGREYVITGGSADYQGICLIVSENLAYELHVARHFVQLAYYAEADTDMSCLHLTQVQTQHFYELLMVLSSYIKSDHCYLKAALRTLYSLFLLDLMNLIEKGNGLHSVNDHSGEIFVSFVHLATQHFKEERSIGFYASKLCISTTHLSRIVRKRSGRTVMGYLDRLLLMEASWLLRSTDLTVAEIAARLHFSHASSFTKFFVRTKGMTPLEYRR